MPTEHPGRKTDGPGRVLNKQSLLKIIWRAQGGKTLCLSAMTCLVFVGLMVGVAPLNAQSNPVYNTSRDVEVTAQMEIRLQQLETQIRELTGRVEQQIYDINQLKQQIQNMSLSNATTAEFPRGASQITPPEREPVVTPAQEKPLDFDFKPPKINGMKTVVPGGGVSADPTAQYEQAYANLKNQKYADAQIGFENYLADHENHVLAANAKYWLGETYYVRGEYQQAARLFAEGFQKYPDSAKSSDMLLKLGMSLAGMGKQQDACVALSQLPLKFPNGSGPVLRRGEQEMSKLDCS